TQCGGDHDPYFPILSGSRHTPRRSTSKSTGGRGHQRSNAGCGLRSPLGQGHDERRSQTGARFHVELYQQSRMARPPVIPAPNNTLMYFFSRRFPIKRTMPPLNARLAREAVRIRRQARSGSISPEAAIAEVDSVIASILVRPDRIATPNSPLCPTSSDAQADTNTIRP